LEEFHSDEPLKIGIERALLQERIGITLEIFEKRVTHLKKSGLVEEGPGGLRLKGWEVKLAPKEEALIKEIENIYLKADLVTPAPEQLTGQMLASEKKVGELLQLLCQMGTLVKVGDNIIFHRQAVEKARGLVEKALQEKGEIETGQFRDMLGASRKYVVALLEYFDALGLTERHGNKRRLKSR